MAHHRRMWTAGVPLFILTLVAIVAASYGHNVQVLNLKDSSLLSSNLIRFDQSQFSNLNSKNSNQEDTQVHRRSRRAASPSCPPITEGEKSKLDGNNNVFLFANDTNFNLAFTWLGEDGKELLALTTMDFGIFTGQSNLWISNDFGRTFENKNDQIGNVIIREHNGINKSPADPKKVIFVGFTGYGTAEETRLYSTINSGDSFTQLSPNFIIEGPLVFHPTNSDWILAHSPTDDYSLWLSKDFGASWTMLERWVKVFHWGESGSEDQSIYAVVDPKEMKDKTFSDFNLKRCKVDDPIFVQILHGVHTFGIQDKFVFASIDSGKDDDNRILKVSINEGKDWNTAQLPSITHEMFYSVLDSTEGMIFLHVDIPGNTGFGTLYTSDADGIVFSESLTKHLYPNGGSVTDFYRVMSIRGVYLASQIQPDQSIRTRITFNRGAEWTDVNKPQDEECETTEEVCNLQIHNQYSRTQGVNLPMGPLSNPNAVGIILVHGLVGGALHSSSPDVYASEDGGYSWRKALDGPHHYAITNYGALLVAVPQSTYSTNVVKYSVDAGQCWYDFVFTSEPISVTGLLPEPYFKSLRVSIWGYDTTSRIWRVFSVDFSAVLEKKCSVDNDDFETWKPHETNARKGCLLGCSETFKRVKSGSRCTVDQMYNHEDHSTTTHCPCTTDDYECDFAFHRVNGEGPCLLDPDFKDKAIDICVDHEEEKEITKGYRLIPGDVCENGYSPDRDLEDLHLKCDNLILSVKTGGHSYVKIILVLIVLMSIIAVAFIVHKNNYLSRYLCFKSTNAMYRYSELSNKDELDNALDKALNMDVDSHVYHDESDDDMLLT